MNENTVEIIYSDGTTARWVVPDKEIEKVEKAIIKKIGDPDTLVC